MVEGQIPVKRVLVVDGDEKFLAMAIAAMADKHEVKVESDLDKGLEHCRAEAFDLVISEVFFGGEPVGMELMHTLFEENRESTKNRYRRLALASSGLSVRSALVIARELPEDIILREKWSGVFDSILHEAETGQMPDDMWEDGITSFTKAKRQYARRVLARAGWNRSETARRLNVSRATIVRYTDQS